MTHSTEASGQSPRRLGSYTTARVTAGRVERLERHAGRLRRDASRLGLPLPSRSEIERVFLETARTAFGRGNGIVRVEWSHLPGEPPELIPTPRSLGSAPKNWRAVSSSTVHPGPEFRANTKYVDVAAYEAGRTELRERGFDEVLLFDAGGWLVEGAHSNFLVVTEDGRLVTPDPSLGPVEGLGLAIVRENYPALAFAKIALADLAAAREFMAVNAVRGVVPVVELDGKPVGSGAPGPWSRRLNMPFSSADYGRAVAAR